MSTDSTSSVRLLRMSEVLFRTGHKSRSTIYDQIGQGLFPSPVKLTGKAVAWVESEVEAWIRSRIEARPAQVPVKPARSRYTRPDTTATTTRSSTSSSTPATTATEAPPRRRGPARTRAQRQQQGLSQ